MSNGREIATWHPDCSGAWIRNVNDDWREAGEWMENIVNNKFHRYSTLSPQERDDLINSYNNAKSAENEDDHVSIGHLTAEENKEIDIIRVQAEVSKARATRAYFKANKDIVDAIMMLA